MIHCELICTPLCGRPTSGFSGTVKINIQGLIMVDYVAKFMEEREPEMVNSIETQRVCDHRRAVNPEAGAIYP